LSVGSSRAAVTARSVINITVHGIGPPGRELHPCEDRTWLSIAQFERLLDAVAQWSNVRITFDDGNVSDVEVALPRLVERGLTAEFFPLVGALGERGRVDHAGVRVLLDAGMAIGSHGWSHRDWRRMDDAQAREELDDAHRVLGELIGRPVSHVSIPFGSYDRHVLRRLRVAGVTCVYTSDGGRARPDAWLQARTSLRQDMDAAWIARVLEHDTSLTRRARNSAARAVKRLRGSPTGMIVPGNVSAGTTGPAQVAAVIVTYNSADVLGDCLRSLSDQEVPLAAVVVADNASKDKTCDIAEDFADLPLRVVELGRNAGYAAAVNAGIAALDLTSLDSVLVLNPDCRVLPGALSVLASALHQSARGIAVPRLVSPDGSLQPSLRRKPTVGRALVQSLLPGGLAGRLGPLCELITDPRAYERPGVTAWATGAAMLLSVQALREVGPWDESFLLFSEETEYSLRAADKGWRTWYEPGAVFEHIGGDSGTNPMLASLLTTNKVVLFRRRHNWLHAAAYFAAVAVGEGIRAAAGRPTSRASIAALLRPSRRVRELAT
jgi:N-acetylglucosaminyl-diphospho-decaprenol L-rhamnosyltransferase